MAQALTVETTEEDDIPDSIDDCDSDKENTIARNFNLLNDFWLRINHWSIRDMNKIKKVLATIHIFNKYKGTSENGKNCEKYW